MSSTLDVVDPFYCVDWFYEGDDMVCTMHGFMWEGHRPYCNAISDDMVALIQYALRAHAALSDINKAIRRHLEVTAG